MFTGILSGGLGTRIKDGEPLMSWAKLDDQFHSHPKLQRAEKHANAVAGLYCRSLSYCAAMLTDGFVDGYWVSTIGTAKEISLTAEVGLWLNAGKGETFLITGRKDSGRRRLEDVTVICPSRGFFIEDYLHFNPSRKEVLEKRKRAADARTSAQSDDARLSAHTPDPTPTREVQGIVRDLPASRPGPVERLAEVMRDFNGRQPVRVYLNALALELNLSEGDFEYARECATGPDVDSPSAVAIDALRKRGKVSA